MNHQIEIDRILNDDGAVLIRQKKHYVYRLSNKKIFVRPKTTSNDWRSAREGLKDLRHALGMKDLEEVKEINPPKAKRSYKPRHEKTALSNHTSGGGVFNSALADQLSLTGLTEKALRGQLETANRQMELLAEENDALEFETSHCHLCRFRRWFRVLLFVMKERLGRSK